MARPPLDLAAREIELQGIDGVAFSLESSAGRGRVQLAMPGLYNVYNALAAAALSLALGVGFDDVVRGLERSSAAFGRFERISLGDKSVLILLIKNPAGANEAIRTLLDAGAPRVAVIALNDDIADGRDVSWIWDVDFEPFAAGAERIVAGGTRAAEMGLRLTYGGLPRDRLEVVPDLEQALDRGLALTPPGGELVVLPTYTAMLALRRIVTGRGHARNYWERAA
jgi:UDP-N-acetylmuramyl tripeptide synthase